MIELLEKKEQLKLAMLHTIEGHALDKEENDAGDIVQLGPDFFCEALESFITELKIAPKSKKSIERYMMELAIEIEEYALYEKIPIQFQAGVFLIEKNRSLMIPYLASIYLHSSIKFMLVEQAFYGEEISMRRMLNKIAEQTPLITQMQDFTLCTAKTLRTKLKEVNQFFETLDVRITQNFVFEGDEKNLRLYFFDMYTTYLSCELTDKGIPLAAKEYEQSAALIFYLENVSHRLSEQEKISFRIFYALALSRLNKQHYLSEGLLGGFFQPTNLLSQRLKRLYDDLSKEMLVQLKGQISQNELELEIRYQLSFLYSYDFSMNVDFYGNLSSVFRGQVEKFFAASARLFEKTFIVALDEKDKLILEEATIKTFAKFIHFKNYSVWYVPSVDFFRENYPIATDYTVLITDLLVKEFHKNYIESDLRYYFNFYFSRLITSMLHILYEPQTTDVRRIYHYTPKVFVYVEFSGEKTRTEFIKSRLVRRYLANIEFLEEINETCDLVITNTLSCEQEKIPTILWLQMQTETMYKRTFSKILAIQKEKLKQLKPTQSPQTFSCFK